MTAYDDANENDDDTQEATQDAYAGSKAKSMYMIPLHMAFAAVFFMSPSVLYTRECLYMY